MEILPEKSASFLPSVAHVGVVGRYVEIAVKYNMCYINFSHKTSEFSQT